MIQSLISVITSREQNMKQRQFLSCHAVRTTPYCKAFLVMNMGAMLFAFIRIFIIPSATLAQLPQDSSMVSFRHVQGFHPIDTSTEPCNCSRTGTPSAKIQRDSDMKVPNIVHYIWYNTKTAPLTFQHMLSIMSAHKILKPDVIYFHTNMEPEGAYWEKVKLIPRFKINYRSPPTELFGEKIKEPMFYTSHSNVDRVKILMEYGGIYMDLDTFIIQPLDELRKYDCTVGLEQPTKVCGSIIICSKTALFLRMWINSYLDDYRMEEWAYNTGQVPANLARRFPDLVHVEETRLNHPNFQELDRIWGPTRFNWQHNYAMHTWYRIWKDMSPYYTGVEPNPESIKTMNNTYGEIARTVYYGSSALMPKDDFD